MGCLGRTLYNLGPFSIICQSVHKLRASTLHGEWGGNWKENFGIRCCGELVEEGITRKKEGSEGVARDYLKRLLPGKERYCEGIKFLLLLSIICDDKPQWLMDLQL